MKVGVPAEVKNHEYGGDHPVPAVPRVVRNAPSGARARRRCGLVAADEDYVAAGATILPSADDVWASADLVLKGEGADRRGNTTGCGKDQVLFTYLHLAADKPAPTRCWRPAPPYRL